MAVLDPMGDERRKTTQAAVRMTADAIERNPRPVRMRHSFREHRFPASRIVIATEIMREGGVEAATALSGTGIKPSQLSDPELKTSPEQFLTMLQNLSKLDARPNAGLIFGQRIRASTYGILGYAVLCASTLREAFDNAMRFQRLTGGVANIEWFTQGEDAIWLPVGADDLSDLDLDKRGFEVARDYQFAAFTGVIGDIMGSWCRPSLARFTGPPPVYADQIAKVLECPLEFESNQNALHYAAPLLDRAPHLASPITAAEVSEACAKLLDQFRWQAGVTRRIYHELTATPGQFPELEEIADRLCMTSRTLRRKLEAEGTSFRQLLDEVRSALAEDYLRSPFMTIDDVAAALGFNEAASFRKAFKRWTGRNPSELRST